jgi:hypothetical protein
MSVNKDRPHVFVLPEDDANRQMAKGFEMEVDPSRTRSIQVLQVAGGWLEVLNRFASDHVADMDRYTSRYIVLLIDFDGKEERRNDAAGRIPERLKDRVFILGALTQPEALRSAGLGTYEIIGANLAKDCREETDAIRSHALLLHNASEISRLRQRVRPILFQ